MSGCTLHVNSWLVQSNQSVNLSAIKCFCPDHCRCIT